MSLRAAFAKQAAAAAGVAPLPGGHDAEGAAVAQKDREEPEQAAEALEDDEEGEDADSEGSETDQESDRDFEEVVNAEWERIFPTAGGQTQCEAEPLSASDSSKSVGQASQPGPRVDRATKSTSQRSGAADPKRKAKPCGRPGRSKAKSRGRFGGRAKAKAKPQAKAAAGGATRRCRTSRASTSSDKPDSEREARGRSPPPPQKKAKGAPKPAWPKRGSRGARKGLLGSAFAKMVKERIEAAAAAASGPQEQAKALEEPAPDVLNLVLAETQAQCRSLAH